MLRDSDTAAIVRSIADRSNPLSWFAGDWPLGNHFYRPISTLTFELDRAFGGSAATFGLTNALLCAMSVFALFWLVRELTDDQTVAAGSASLFALWHGTVPGWISLFAWAMAGVTLLFGLFKSRNQFQALLGACLWTYVAYEIGGLAPLEFRMLQWIPGRTASVMTMFALVSLAAYARYERISAEWRATSPRTPLDPPATKGTELRRVASHPYVWAIISLAALALALGSYEQAVVIPILLFGVALTLRAQGYGVRWWWIAGSFAVLAAYLLVRSQVVSFEPSGYQRQQFRASSSVIYAVLDFVMPSIFAMRQFASVGDAGLLFFVTSAPYAVAARVLGDLAAIWKVAMANSPAFFAYLGAAIAFFPMAWLKPFDHYYYLPLALRALFVVFVVGAALRASISAASPREIQAPPRQHPAPGSLPRR